MQSVGVTFLSQYDPTDIVRITIEIDENYEKQDVIDAVCEAMENEPTFSLHDTTFTENAFFANVQYSLIKTIKDVEGVKRVKTSKKVGLTSNQTNQQEMTQEETVSTEIDIKNEATAIDVTSYFLGGMILAVVFVLFMKNFKKK